MSVFDNYVYQNFIIIVGAEPGRGVKADTKLIRDALRNFKEKYN